MPWREVCYMEERLRFIAARVSGDESMTELCERFGVSRKTGYKLWRRYLARGPAGLEDDSRAPHRVPWAITEAQAQAIVGLRRAHPSWGPKKLRATLMRRAPEQSWPALSTIGELLRRRGLSMARRRRRRATPSELPLSVASSANDVWAIDFKGWFRTGDGARCDPLTVTDQFSRYLLCARVVSAPTAAGCRPELERLFRAYGLPRVIRSDNGPPFASLGAGGLSRLAVWWIKLGIIPERIEPGQPQQNGRHERMHATLKAETARPPAASLAAQQLRFDRFRAEFNHERPHEALGQNPPAQFYTASSRRYPRRLEDPVYPAAYQLRRVRSNGEIKWHGALVFIGQALTGEIIGLREIDDARAAVYFGPLPLGIIDEVSGKLIHPHRRRGDRERRRGQPPSHSSPSQCEKVLPMLPV
jgi:putative transposase